MKYNWRSELFSWSVIAAMFTAAAWAWNRVPEKIPTHWNAAGEVDGYGGRFMGLLLLPLVSVGLYLLFLVLPKLDPGKANYEGFARVYSIFRNLFIAYMGVIYSATTLAALGYRVDMGRVIAISLGILFIVLGNYLGKVRPNWFVGVRTPWTLSSKLSWTKTHRLAGWLFVMCGAATLICGVIRPAWGVFAMLGTMFPSVLAMTVYSYVVWKNDPERTVPAGTSPAGE